MLIRFGNWNSGALDGLFTFNVNESVAYAGNVNIGFRLALLLYGQPRGVYGFRDRATKREKEAASVPVKREKIKTDRTASKPAG